MRQLTKEELASLEIIIVDTGFTIWFTDEHGNRRWVIDGSSLRENGIIDLGINGLETAVNAKYSKGLIKLFHK